MLLSAAIQLNNPNENGKSEIIPVDDNVKEIEIVEKVENTELAHTKNSPQKTTKQIVKEYFADTPVLIDVALCESHFTQFDANGNVLRGRTNLQDVGVMQINEKYHLDTSKKLGLDIYTLEGNLAYARYLYNNQGTKPWEYSSKCWNKNREVALK